MPKENTVSIDLHNGDSWTFKNPVINFYPPVGSKFDGKCSTMILVLPLGAPELRKQVTEAVTKVIHDYHQAPRGMFDLDWLREQFGCSNPTPSSAESSNAVS